MTHDERILLAIRDPRFLERFWRRVDRTSACGCWEWTAAKANGYGRIGVRRYGGGMVYAHRVSWALHRGDGLVGRMVCHHCDNRPCVNPDHFFLGDHRSNCEDMLAKGRGNFPGVPGSRNAAHKLSEPDVREIRASSARGERQKDIAARYGVDRNTIFGIVSLRTWRHVPPHAETN